ncbi:MAG: Mrp/NBP35 family ATP-binding protein [Candidatus Glassbacteria bacterium]|nr:Mrp/NBP35 family ATP-binding protein [Candidatus Glassbacteria bacterium]
MNTAADPRDPARQERERRELKERLGRIRHKVIVLSGKGGVGKSTVAANLAVCLAESGRTAGLLDIDIHGPSIPRLMNLEGRPVEMAGETIFPVAYGEKLKVMSIGFLLRREQDAVIWRGPLKMSIIKQFLKDVEWGELDFLVIDSPPGTGDEPLSVCQLVEDADGAIVVATPQALALADVRKSINFCRKLGLRIIGVIENMSGFICPKCGELTEVFGSGGGEAMSAEMGVPFLGRIPIDAQVVKACDSGTPYLSVCRDTAAARAFRQAFQPVIDLGRRGAGEPGE